MKIGQFEKAEKIMKEIREIDKFTKMYKESYRISVVVKERGATSLDKDRDIHFFAEKDSQVYKDILAIINKRADELIGEFEKI